MVKKKPKIEEIHEDVEELSPELKRELNGKIGDAHDLMLLSLPGGKIRDVHRFITFGQKRGVRKTGWNKESDEMMYVPYISYKPAATNTVESMMILTRKL